MDPSKIPLAPNPNGDPPNFNGGPNLETTILATGMLLVLFSASAVAIRFYTGFNLSQKYFIDDCTIYTEKICHQDMETIADDFV